MQRLLKLTMIGNIAMLLAASAFAAPSTNTFTVATYNVENWLLMERSGKPDQPKPADQKKAVFDVLAHVRADVLGLEEMGTKADLAELADGLKARGLEYPHVEWIESSDTNRHVALLSRFPIAQRFSRTDYTYLLAGKPTRVQRGLLDVQVKFNDAYSFRVIVAHLKSKRQTPDGDQAVMRGEEAKLLRTHIGKALKDEPQMNLIAIGDLNDTPDSEPVRTIIGVAPFALMDLMPVDSKGGRDTHLWRARSQFSRIDYLVVSPGMANEYVPESARIVDVEGWDKASDHRAVYAKFYAEDRKTPPAPATTESSTQTRYAAILGLVAFVIVAGSATITVVSRQRPSQR
jgi:endonuclease/exonuclease/phosphatase family metal-dependent hydrolase